MIRKLGNQLVGNNIFYEEEKFVKQKNEMEKQGHGKLGFLRKFLTTKVVAGILIAIVVIIGALGLKKAVEPENKTIKIGFEDIGKLATQSAYCTKVNVTKDPRKLFGVAIPFTESKYIYSYDVAIKAGFDFEEIEWKENGTSIEVKLPKVKILSNEINYDSFKVYHEEESIFSQITLEENNDAIKELKRSAEEDAIANGLFENARSNVETVLTGFFGNVYNLEEYKLIFKDK